MIEFADNLVIYVKKDGKWEEIERLNRVVVRAEEEWDIEWNKKIFIG